MQRPQEGCHDDWLLWAWILTWRLQLYVYIQEQKKERSSSLLDRCIQKTLLIKCMTRKKITCQWTVAASTTSSANRPGSSPGSHKCGLSTYNCSCTTASLSFLFNYRYLLDLAGLSDWISSLSNRPEVVFKLRGEGKKGRKGRSAV